MQKEPEIIEHNPHEKGGKRWSNSYLWFVWLVLLALWLLYFVSSDPIDWTDIALGFGTGIALLGTVIETCGNKLPDWYRRMYD